VIGVTYRVVPVEGEPYTFASHMGCEMAWERYAAKHGLPIMPKQVRGGVDMSGFPMATSAAVIAWAHSKTEVPFEEWAEGILSVVPDVGGGLVAEVPDPTPPGHGPG
jgi:hypothetical protein